MSQRDDSSPEPTSEMVGELQDAVNEILAEAASQQQQGSSSLQGSSAKRKKQQLVKLLSSNRHMYVYLLLNAVA